MTNRIIGYDLARALAVFGMVVVNFKTVMSAEQGGPAWLGGLVGLLDGRAAATFVVLAGVGIALISRKARTSQKRDQLMTVYGHHRVWSAICSSTGSTRSSPGSRSSCWVW